MSTITLSETAAADVFSRLDLRPYRLVILSLVVFLAGLTAVSDRRDG